MKKLTAKEVFTREAYEGLTADFSSGGGIRRAGC